MSSEKSVVGACSYASSKQVQSRKEDGLDLPTLPSYRPALKNGCNSASLGVIRLAGSSARHRSIKSMNDVRNLSSSSFILDWARADGISRARRSRVGFEKGRTLMKFYLKPKSTSRRGKEKVSHFECR